MLFMSVSLSSLGIRNGLRLHWNVYLRSVMYMLSLLSCVVRGSVLYAVSFYFQLRQGRQFSVIRYIVFLIYNVQCNV